MNELNTISPNRQRYQIRHAEAKSILAKTSGFIAEAGFSHSLTPARNCTFACTYCYVPTLRVYGGLRPEDWKRWGQFTTFKSNAPELLYRAVRSDQRDIVKCCGWARSGGVLLNHQTVLEFLSIQDMNNHF